MYFDWILWLALIIFFLVVLAFYPGSFRILWYQILHHGGDEDREDIYDVIDSLFGPAVQDEEE